jgi:hypothetical protein
MVDMACALLLLALTYYLGNKTHYCNELSVESDILLWHNT